MEQDPVGGYGLLAAASNLLGKLDLSVLASGLHGRNMQDARDAQYVAHVRGVLWDALAAALRSGQLHATGFAPGTLRTSAIDPAFFNNATPDFNQDRVTSHDVTYAGVRIFRRSSTSPSVPSIAPPPAAPVTDGRRPFELAAAMAEFVGIKFGWEKGGKRTLAPTERDIEIMVAQRFLDGWVRKDIRTLHRIWSEVDRRRGPRKSAAAWRNLAP